MGNKHAQRLLTGTSFHATQTDQERATVCDKMFKTYKKGLNYKHVEDISAEKLMQLMRQDQQEKGGTSADDSTVLATATDTETASRREIVLVDCRDDYERLVSSIPGSIGQSELEKRLQEGWQLNSQTHQLVFFCTIGYRSGVSAHKFAEKTNIAPVYNLAGSLLSWVHSGGELQDPTTGLPSEQLHVFGPAWDLAPHHITTVIGGKRNKSNTGAHADKQSGMLKVLTQGKHLVTGDESNDGDDNELDEDKQSTPSEVAVAVDTVAEQTASSATVASCAVDDPSS